jgi:hypothetical protein
VKQKKISKKNHLSQLAAAASSQSVAAKKRSWVRIPASTAATSWTTYAHLLFPNSFAQISAFAML